MSKIIDEKVVQMKFDNKNFEKNVNSTLSTLDKLKNKLNFKESVKSLDLLNKKSKDTNLNGLTNAITAVHNKFSALEVMGVTALANITNSAVNAGKKIVSALTIDPIRTGFSEYETQINAVQTILANTESKGTTLQQVNKALNELNKYADLTIYNFTEMTKNIGTFTAAGIDLKTSVSAIQGIANLAAVSGSTSQQASVAMYQLSQALASGTVKLMDWNSVVNAGMGGQVFQDALKETAKVHGTNVDAIIKKEGSFRESLKEGWITSEILTETLEKFTMAAEEGTEKYEAYKKSLKEKGYTEQQATEILKMAKTATEAATKVKTFSQLWGTLQESAQSGWTQTWEILVGDFEEAKIFLTTISDTIGNIISKSADARNSLLSGGLSTGWKQLLKEGIADEAGLKDELNKVAKESGFEFNKLISETEKKGGTFNDALRDALNSGKITSDILTKSISNLTDKMSKMSAKELEAAGYTKDQVLEMQKLNKAFKDGTLSMDEFVSKMKKKSGRENVIQALTNSFNGIMLILKNIKEAFREIFPALQSKQLYSFTENLLRMSEQFNNFVVKTGPNIKNTFKGIFSILNIGVNIIKKLLNGFVGLFTKFDTLPEGILKISGSFGEWLIKISNIISESKILDKIINTVFSTISNGIDNVKKFLTPGIKTVIGGISKLIDVIIKLSHSLSNILSEALRNGDLHSLMSLFNGGVISTILIAIQKFIKSVTSSFDGFSGTLSTLKGILESYQNDLKAKTLIKIAKAVGILAGALFVISTIKEEKLISSLSAMTGSLVILMGALSLLILMTSKIKNMKKMVVTLSGLSMTLVTLANALLIFSVALKIISTIKWDEMKVALAGLAGGLIAISVALTGLVIAANLLKGGAVNNLKPLSKMIKKLATSLLIFSVALKVMSTIKWDEMKVALAGLAGGLIAMIAAINMIPKNVKIKTGGLIAISTSLVILSAALKIISTLSWEDIGKGLLTISIGLNRMVKSIRKTNGMKAGNLIAISTSLVILGGALKIFASLSWEDLGKGFLVVTIGLNRMVKSIQKTNGMKAGSLIAIATSLVILGSALKLIGSLDIKTLAKSIGAIAISLGILWAAAKYLSPMSAALIKLSVAIGIFSLSIVGIGVGLTLIATGITALSVALSAGVTSIVAGLSGILLGILKLVPEIFKIVKESIIQLCLIIKDCAPLIAETILVLISSTFDLLATYVPKIASSMYRLMIGVMDEITKYAPEFIKKGVEMISSILGGIASALKDLNPEDFKKGVETSLLLLLLVSGLGALAPLLPKAMIGVLGFGVVLAELTGVLAALGAMYKIPGLKELINNGGALLQSIGTAIGRFIGGIAGGISVGFTASLPKVATNLSDFMTNLSPFINSINSVDASFSDKAINVAKGLIAFAGSSILTSISSFISGGEKLATFGTELSLFMNNSKDFFTLVKDLNPNILGNVSLLGNAIGEISKSSIINGISSFVNGGSSLGNFGNDLKNLGSNLKSFINELSDIDPNKITSTKSAAEILKILSETAKELPNEGGWLAKLVGDNSITNFSGSLPKLAKDVNEFINSLGDFNPEKATLAKSVAEVINALAEASKNIPNEGGWLAKLVGDNGLVNFSGSLPKLAKDINEFITNLGDFNSEKVTSVKSVAEVINALAEASKNIPNEDGWITKIVGDNSLGKFGNKLPGLGSDINGFITNLGEFGIDKVEVAKSVADVIIALAEASKNIPNEDGWITKIVGDNSLGKFGNKLPGLGSDINGFITNLGEVTPDKIEVAKSVSSIITALAEASKSIPNENGVWQKIIGENGLASFSNKLPDLGTHIKEFINNLGEFGTDKINTVNAAAESVKSIATLGSINLGDMTNKIDSFGGKLPTFSTKIKEFIDKISEIKSETITSVNTRITELSNMFNNFTSINIDSLNNFNNALNTAGANGIKSFVNEVCKEDYKLNVLDTLQNMMDRMVDKINNNVSKIVDAANNMMNKVVEKISNKEYINNAESAGKYFAEGFANGITWNSMSATKAGYKLGRDALIAAKEAIDSNSPSKETFKLGKFFDDGFINGISKYSNNVYNTAYSMGDDATNGLKNAMNNISNIISDDIDTTPRIRPILDLSNIEANSNRLSYLLGDNGVSINANIASISGRMSKYQSQDSNVISAINKLRKDIGNINNNTYNINGVTYDDGSNINNAVETLVRAAKIERRR